MFFFHRRGLISVILGLRVPVEAEAVQALLAWFVNGVESGAGILLLSAIWETNMQHNHASI